MKRLLTILSGLLGGVLLLASAACITNATSRSTFNANEVPQGIILIVGDGMGAAHFTLARILRGDDFQIGQLAQTGLVATASANSRATDSAAAATAYATGIKTNNGYLGLDPSGRSHPTVVEIAESRGLATGLVTTARFGDATPAAFAAHVRDRHETSAIATQLVSSGVDVLASNGLDWFGSEGAPTLEELANDGGYLPVRTAAELQAAGTGPVLAVFPSGELDGDSPELPLRELALWAIDRLSDDPDGFFLLIEHEGTDGASHNNNTAALETSLRSLDETVGAVLDFARKRGDILVIVVGDHETGGLQIAGSWGTPQDSWATRDHTGEAIPIFAAGPGAAAFAGFQENTTVGNELLSLARRMGR
ncbi:MAG: alkaline phosphatase [Woeseia sp.]